MVLVQGYMNLYKSGFYHRTGKPDGNINVHGGDVYLTFAEAASAAEPDKGYLTTVSVEYYADVKPVPNAVDSEPVPLSMSRKAFARIIKRDDPPNFASKSFEERLTEINKGRVPITPGAEQWLSD